MSLRERLAQGPEPRRSKGKIQAVLEALGDDDRVVLEDALANRRTYPSEFLADVLTSLGHPVSPSTVREYRRSVKL